MDTCRLTHIVMKYQPVWKSNTEGQPVNFHVETGTAYVACHWKRNDDDGDGNDVNSRFN